MKTLTEEIFRIKSLINQFDIIEEQDARTTSAASGPQKCGNSHDSGGYNSGDTPEEKRANKQAKSDAKSDLKKTFNMYYDINNYEYPKDVKQQISTQFKQFKSLLDDGQSDYSSEKKFSIVNKILEYIHKFPNISLTKRISTKFNNPNIQSATIEDIIGYAKKMGWDNFINWYLNQCY